MTVHCRQRHSGWPGSGRGLATLSVASSHETTQRSGVHRARPERRGGGDTSRSPCPRVAMVGPARGTQPAPPVGSAGRRRRRAPGGGRSPWHRTAPGGPRRDRPGNRRRSRGHRDRARRALAASDVIKIGVVRRYPSSVSSQRSRRIVTLSDANAGEGRARSRRYLKCVFGVHDVAGRALELRRGRVILSSVHDAPEAVPPT